MRKTLLEIGGKQFLLCSGRKFSNLLFVVNVENRIVYSLIAKETFTNKLKMLVIFLLFIETCKKRDKN